MIRSDCGFASPVPASSRIQRPSGYSHCISEWFFLRVKAFDVNLPEPASYDCSQDQHQYLVSLREQFQGVLPAQMRKSQASGISEPQTMDIALTLPVLHDGLTFKLMQSLLFNCSAIVVLNTTLVQGNRNRLSYQFNLLFVVHRLVTSTLTSKSAEIASFLDGFWL